MDLSRKNGPVQDIYRVDNSDLGLGFSDPDQEIEEIYRDDLELRGHEGNGSLGLLDDNDFGGPLTFATRPDEEFCEVSPPARAMRSDILTSNWAGSRSQVRNLTRNRRGDEEVFYSPDRGPPIRDFFTVFTAFLVAIFAAYYSITE